MQCDCNQLPSGTFDHVCIIHSDLVSMEMEAAVIAEREACAKIADDVRRTDERINGHNPERAEVASDIATAIRVRGDQP